MAAENRLGPPQPMLDNVSSSSSLGITLTVSIGGQERRDGFEILRDVVTRHRRSWVRDHLETYLRNRWGSDLRAVVEEHHRIVGDRGKPPTAKQLAKFAADPANRWAGGDLTAVLGMVGLTAPPAPRRSTLLREDARRFAARVFGALGGETCSWAELCKRHTGAALQEAYEKQEALHTLAVLTPLYVQLLEAVGRAPEMKQLGTRKLTDAATMLRQPVAEMWRAWGRAVEDALATQPP